MSPGSLDLLEPTRATTAPLLDVTNLEIGFDAGDQHLPIVRGIDLTIRHGEATGLVGESGCGKTLTSLALLGVLPQGARRTAGCIRVAGVDLPPSGDGPLWHRVRGRQLAMVFQEPATALNPVLRIGTQVAEVLRRSDPTGEPPGRHGRSAARRLGVEWLERVALPDPQQRWRCYPHELSGGQRQRVMLAMALAAGADLLIADEPTTALDVTVQAQILDLLAKLRRDLGLALLLITHDLAVVSQTCDSVAIMDRGRIVERGDTASLFARPQHVVTQRLLAAAGGPPVYTSPLSESPDV